MENRWIWPFELEDQIGSGGMGVVYRARFVKNNRRVALKLLPPEIAANTTVVARFQRELEILKDLRHQNIVHCFGGTCEGARQFYAMELVEGGTIESVIRDRGTIPYGRTVEYALELCSALAYAHSRGIVHRDIKPGNLLLTKDGKMKLGDFGLALVAAGNKLTAAGKTMGTLLYMAPEQIRGHPPLSNKTDLYAMGCVLFEMLTGKPPFMGNSPGEVLHQHIHVEAPKLRTVLKECPPGLESVISDLLEKDPEKRPSDAYAVAQRLKGFEESVTVKSARNEHNIGNQPTKTVVVERAALERPSMLNRTAAEVLIRQDEDRRTWIETSFSWKSFAIAGALMLAAWGLSLYWMIPERPPPGPYDRAETVLVGLYQDHDPSLRVVAARALGQIGPAAKGTLPLLEQHLSDPDPRVRTETINTAEKFGAAAHPLLSALSQMSQTDESSEIRQRATEAIERIKQDAPAGARSSPLRAFETVGVMILCIALFAAGMWILAEKRFD